MTNIHARADIAVIVRNDELAHYVAPVANVIADQFSTSGRAAIRAAIALNRSGLVITAHQARQARHGGITYDAVLAAVNEAEDGEE